MDLFENTVLCKNCGKKMRQISIEKNGFRMRALKCPSCSNQIFHPSDIEEFKKFNSLKDRPFQVKLRLVGNSYTVSIPREIVNFMQESEDEEDDFESAKQKIHASMSEHMKQMEKFVTLAMEDANKIALSFNTVERLNNPNNKIKHIRVIKIRKRNPAIQENVEEE